MHSDNCRSLSFGSPARRTRTPPPPQLSFRFFVVFSFVFLLLLLLLSFLCLCSVALIKSKPLRLLTEEKHKVFSFFVSAYRVSSFSSKITFFFLNKIFLIRQIVSCRTTQIQKPFFGDPFKFFLNVGK